MSILALHLLPAAKSLAICLMLVMAYCQNDSSHVCVHGKYESNPELILDESNNTGRTLQSFQNMRIHFDFTKISETSPELNDYLANVIIPPAKNYWESALKVNPMNGNLKSQGLIKMCDGTIDVPELYQKEGVKADLVMFVDIVNDNDGIFIAYTSSCALSSSTRRPVFARIVYNIARLQPTANNVLRERDILITLHETTHVLGFSKTHYNNYLDPATNERLQGHVFTKEVNGAQVTVLNLEPLTSRLRKHFNCPTLEGAYLENEGGAGSFGQHFERRILYNEYMTPGVLKDAKITEFSLALLEGTGWYQVDYSLAEPITWGKNQGCEFLDTPCVNKETGQPNFKEFCSPLGSMGVSWTGRGAGVCGASKIKSDLKLGDHIDYWRNKTVLNDGFSDNCPIYTMYNNMDCEDEDLKKKAVLPNQEFYGAGSRCFKGTLAPPGKSIKSSYFYCFKPICELQPDGDYYLKVIIGSKVVICQSSRPVAIPGLTGTLLCPNVNDFCNQITSEGFCKRGCFGRGKCVDKKCRCDDGWGGPDCSKKIYDDNCKRCEEEDPFRTSCFGDSCECNPDNSTCAKEILRSQKYFADDAFLNENTENGFLGDIPQESSSDDLRRLVSTTEKDMKKNVPSEDLSESAETNVNRISKDQEDVIYYDGGSSEYSHEALMRRISSLEILDHKISSLVLLVAIGITLILGIAMFLRYKKNYRMQKIEKNNKTGDSVEITKDNVGISLEGF